MQRLHHHSRHCEERNDEAISLFSGLLRYARNDGSGACNDGNGARNDGNGDGVRLYLHWRVMATRDGRISTELSRCELRGDLFKAQGIDRVAILSGMGIILKNYAYPGREIL